MENILKILILICMLVAAILVFIIITTTAKKRDSKEEKEKLIVLNKSRTNEQGEKLDGIMLYLSKNGAMDNVGIKTPEQYIIAKVVLTVIGFIVGISAFGNYLCIFTALIGFLILDFLIRMSNSQDNKNMIADLKNIYDTLRIQIKAGVFLSEALRECYLVISNKRLKNAFYQLNKEIALKHDVEYAVNQLSVQFNNVYVNNFVTIISQSIQTGQTVNMLENISEQMREAEKKIHMVEKRKLDNKMTMLAMFVLIGAFVMLLYMVFTYGIGSGLADL